MSLPLVVVTRQLPPKVWDHLSMHAQVVCWEFDRPVTHEWLLDKIPEAEGLYCLLTDRIDRAILGFGKRLRVSARCRSGMTISISQHVLPGKFPLDILPGS